LDGGLLALVLHGTSCHNTIILVIKKIYSVGPRRDAHGPENQKESV
jgi:hypothetical protein